MKIATLSDLLQHLGLAQKPPRHIEVHSIGEICDWIKAAWNFGHAAGVKETQDEYHAKEIEAIAEADMAEAKANAADAGLYLAAFQASQTCTRECKRRLRTDAAVVLGGCLVGMAVILVVCWIF